MRALFLATLLTGCTTPDRTHQYCAEWGTRNASKMECTAGWGVCVRQMYRKSYCKRWEDMNG